MKTRLFLIFVLCSLLGLSACSTGNLKKINPIIIPNGLTEKEAVAGMVNTIVQTQIAPQKNDDRPAIQWAGIVDSLLSARVFGYQSQYNSKTRVAKMGWYIESVDKEAGAVVFGFKRRSHYMSVQMAVDESKTRIVPTVLLSENLNQGKNSIHSSAIEWINALSTDIRRSLGYMGVLKSQVMDDSEHLVEVP